MNETTDTKKYKEWMMDLVVPAIIEKWPTGELSDPNYKIIQQYCAGGHCSVIDLFLLNTIRECEEDGLVLPGKIIRNTQPSNSSDLNVI